MTGPGRWTDAELDRWRSVADPAVDPLSRAVFEAGGPAALGRLTHQLDDWDAPLPDDLTPGLRAYFEAPLEYPTWVDRARIRRAEDLFALFGPMIVSTVLLNGFPRFLTCPAGAHAMYRARIFSPESVASRMLQLAQFALFMGERDGLSVMPGEGGRPRLGRGAMAYRKLRVVHANVRQLLLGRDGPARWDERYGMPINQEDLALGTLCFCLGQVEGLERAGFSLSADDGEAMLMGWRTASWLLGLDEALQPATVDEARALRNLMLRRHQRATEEGAVVIREMLRVVEGLLPWGTRRVPAALVRYQIGHADADMLQIDHARGLLALFRWTQPLWKSTRLFEHASRLVSPRLLAWAAAPARLGAPGRLELPASLAARLGTER